MKEQRYKPYFVFQAFTIVLKSCSFFFLFLEERVKQASFPCRKQKPVDPVVLSLFFPLLPVFPVFPQKCEKRKNKNRKRGKKRAKDGEFPSPGLKFITSKLPIKVERW